MPTVEGNGGGLMVTIQRKTVEDIIAGREERGCVSGGVNGESNDCESDRVNNSNKVNGGVNGGVNDTIGGVNSNTTLLNHFTTRQNRIKEIIKLKPSVTVQQMVAILSISRRTLERELSVLQKAKVIRHEGSDKSGTWVVLEPYNSKE